MTFDHRDFPYPLNVFLHVLAREEGAVAALHYGLFESKGDSIGAVNRARLRISLGGRGVVDEDVAALRDLWKTAFERAIESAEVL